MRNRITGKDDNEEENKKNEKKENKKTRNKTKMKRIKIIEDTEEDKKATKV